MPPITVLFDIDGTLLKTGGVGLKAINQTFLDLFGIENTTQVKLHGRTDYAILSDLFAANSIDFDSNYRSFSDHYHSRLQSKLEEIDGTILPGVTQLLQQLESEEFQLGVLTGNAKVAAQLKLKRFELNKYFEFGGFGDGSPCRNAIAAEAVQDAKMRLKSNFQIENCWVIGDTPADVECARSVGAKAVAVLTGGFERDDFDNQPADSVLNDLTEISPNHFR